MSAKGKAMTAQTVMNAPGSDHHRFGRINGNVPTRIHWSAISNPNPQQSFRSAGIEDTPRHG
jgi:hypothetical protein